MHSAGTRIPTNGFCFAGAALENGVTNRWITHPNVADDLGLCGPDRPIASAGDENFLSPTQWSDPYSGGVAVRGLRPARVDHAYAAPPSLRPRWASARDDRRQSRQS